MKRINVFKRIISTVCSICILMSGLSISVSAAEIDGNSEYGWTGVSLAKQPTIPFSMDFNKAYEGSLGVAAENTTLSDVVKITNSSGNVAWAAPLDYTLKGENDGIVKLTYTNVDGTDTKNKNEIYIFNSSATVKTAHTIEFDLYLDGNYSDVGFQERNVYSGWSNNSFKEYFKTGWQKVAMVVTANNFELFVDGASKLAQARKFDEGKSAFLRLWVSVTEQGKSATVAIDNLRIKEGAYYTNVAVIDSTSESFVFDDNSTSVLLYNEGNVTSKVVNNGNNFATIDYTLKGNNDGVARADFSSSADADLRGTMRLAEGMNSADFTLEFELYADGGADSIGFLGNNIVEYDHKWLSVLNNYIVRNQWNDVALSFSGTNAYLYVNGTKVSERANNITTSNGNGWLRLGVQFTGTQEGQTRTATIAIDNLKAYEGAYTGEVYTTQAVINSTSESFDFNNEAASVLLYNEGSVTSKVVKNGNNFAAIDYTLKGNNDGVARADFSSSTDADLRGTMRLAEGMNSSDFTLEFELYADGGADSIGFLGNNIVEYDHKWLSVLNNYIVRNQWNDVALSFSGTNAYLYVNGTKVSERANNITTSNGNGWLRLGVQFTGTQAGQTRTATIAIDNLKAYVGAYTGEVIIPEFTSADGGLRVIPSYGGVVIDKEYTAKEVYDIISAAYTDYAISVLDKNSVAVADDKLVVYGDYVKLTKGTFTKNYTITNGKVSEINFESKTAGVDDALLTDTHHVANYAEIDGFTKLNVNGVNTVATAGYESNVGGKEGIAAYVNMEGVPANGNATFNGGATRSMLDSMPRTADLNLIDISKLDSPTLTLDYTMQFKVYATGDLDGIDLLSRQYYLGDSTKKTYLDIVKFGFGENNTWVSRLSDDDEPSNDYIGVKLEKDRWYDIALEFDLSECTFDLYIDGDYKATGSVGKQIYTELNGIVSMALKPIFNEGVEKESRTGKFYWDDGQTYFGGYKTVMASSPVVDETAKSVTLSAYADSAYPQDGTLIVACYNEGRLEEVKFSDAAIINGETSISVNYEGDFATYDDVKVMFWESMSSMKPYISFELK